MWKRGMFVVCVIAWPLVASGEHHQLPDVAWIKSITASSTFASRKNAYDPRLTVFPKTTYQKKAEAYRYDSAWCEGKPDEGIGEGVTITFVAPTPIATLTIKPGVWMTDKLFKANNIITGLQVSTDDGRVVSVAPKPAREEVEVKLGGAPVTSLTVKITAVQKGKMNDSCISEIALDRSAAMGFEAAAIAALPGAVDDVLDAVWGDGCKPDVIAKYAVYPLPFTMKTNYHGETGIVSSTRKLKSAADFAKVCKGDLGGNAWGTEDVPLDASLDGEISVGFSLAEVMQSVRLAWRGGRWRLVAVE
jgi:hypothetical protein